MTTRQPPVSRSALPSILAVGLVTVALHLTGSDALATPRSTDPELWGRWVRSTDPATIGFSLGRLLCLAISYHLLVSTTLATTGRVLHRPGLVRAADRFTLPGLRTPIRRVVGLGITATAALATPLPRAAGSPGTAGDGGTATLWMASPGLGTATLTAVADDPPEPPRRAGSATVSVVGPSVAGDEEPHLSEHHDAAHSSSEQPPADPLDPDRDTAPVSSSDRHLVVPGDHLWAIAERTVEAREGTAPEAVVERYWRQLVLANPHLADPDLVFPGDVIDLPPVRHTG